MIGKLHSRQPQKLFRRPFTPHKVFSLRLNCPTLPPISAPICHEPGLQIVASSPLSASLSQDPSSPRPQRGPRSHSPLCDASHSLLCDASPSPLQCALQRRTARAMAHINWRTINIDALDPESAANFDIESLRPAVAPVSAAEVQVLAGQVRQLLRGGDAEGALRGALENAPYGGDAAAKELHLAAVVEVLQSIKQADMSPILTRIYESGGSETLDALMKYLYVCPTAVGWMPEGSGASPEGGARGPLLGRATRHRPLPEPLLTLLASAADTKAWQSRRLLRPPRPSPPSPPASRRSSRASVAVRAAPRP